MPAPPFKVVIPSRLGSSRLPDKPLADLGGRPMVARVVEQLEKCGADEVIVATDDTRVCDAVAGLSCRCLLTRSDHRTGTDRLAEVARVERWADDTIVVNVQGDEPFLPVHLPSTLATALHEDAHVGVATVAVPIHSPDELFTPSVVKVVLDGGGRALYFSRAPIPWVRDVFGREGRPASLPADVPFLRHVGLYAYRAGTLRRIAEISPTQLERSESLEQLRVLETGSAIRVLVVPEAPPPGVDTQDDLERARAFFGRRS